MNETTTILAVLAIIVATISAIISATGVNVEEPILPSIITGEVPIGAVIDLWCTSPCEIPDGFAIADGSMVTDVESPLVNTRLPDLRGKFVRGTLNETSVGLIGGSDTSNIQLFGESFQTEVSGRGHSHVWSVFETDGANDWLVWDQRFGNDVAGQNMLEIVSWGNGLGDEGQGIFPLAVTSDEIRTGDVHFVTQRVDTTHYHNVNAPNATSSINTTPPYMELMKIVRIK